MEHQNDIKIIISKHAIQRREHYTPIDKDILINLVKQIDDKFAISKKENNIYKISHKNTIAIIKKTDDSSTTSSKSYPRRCCQSTPHKKKQYFKT